MTSLEVEVAKQSVEIARNSAEIAKHSAELAKQSAEIANLGACISLLEVRVTERVARLEGITIGRQEVGGNGGAPNPAGDD